MKNEGKIKRVERVKTGRYVHGTTFAKGDYIPTMVFYVVYLVGGAVFETSREKILSCHPGRKRVTEPMLDSFKGKDANVLRFRCR